MTVQGTLSEMSLASLVEMSCNDMSQARLHVRNGDAEALLFFDSGNLVHAQLGEREGEQALFDLLTWAEGEFELEQGIASPKHSISGPWAGLLLEGMRRVDEAAGRAQGMLPSESESQALPSTTDVPRRLKGVDGVAGVVLVSQDGIVLQHDLQGDPEREGAVAAFVGNAASQITEALGLGGFRRGLVEMGSRGARTLVLPRGDCYMGLLLEERASPTLVASQLESLLR